MDAFLLFALFDLACDVLNLIALHQQGDVIVTWKEIPLDRVRVTPGSHSTALGVNVDNGRRWCGACLRPVDTGKLLQICPHCGHRWAWFQILTDAGALADQVPSEARLGKFIRERAERMAAEPSPLDLSPPDEE